jgi:uncharacterized protein YabE (DUF348 family)
MQGARPAPHRRKFLLPPLAGVRAGVALLVPLLALGWLAGEKTVLLQVDGKIERVSTHADTVAELLERSGVEFAPGDHVAPAPTTGLADGMVVEYVASRTVTVLVEGERRELTVPALRAEDVLGALGAPGELLAPAPLSRVYDGMVLEVGVPVTVIVDSDGERREISAPARATVGDLLRRLDIPIDGDDRVTPGLDEPLAEGDEIVVQRVRTTIETRQLEVPAPVTRRATATLPEGEQREVAPGRPGALHVLETVTWVDGVPESRVRTQEHVLSAPKARVVEVGTADESPSETSTQRSSSSSSSRTQTGEASWYVYGSGYTAAHRTLPKGTVVTVTNLDNGLSVDVTINDRGPYIDGRVIDLNKVAFEEIASTSQGVIDVRISW